MSAATNKKNLDHFDIIMFFCAPATSAAPWTSPASRAAPVPSPIPLLITDSTYTKATLLFKTMGRHDLSDQISTFFFHKGLNQATLIAPVTNRTDRSLADAIIRLRKFDLDQRLRATIEEAWDLLSDGHLLEAEALVENVDVRVRQTQSPQHAGAPSL